METITITEFKTFSNYTVNQMKLVLARELMKGSELKEEDIIQIIGTHLQDSEVADKELLKYAIIQVNTSNTGQMYDTIKDAYFETIGEYDNDDSLHSSFLLLIMADSSFQPKR